MKKLLCIALLVPSVAFAAAGKQASSEGYYGRFDLGMDIRKDNKLGEVNIKDNKTPVFGMGVGYQFNEYFSSDLNLQFRALETINKEDKSDKLKNKTTTLMLNGNAQLPTGTIFTPYVTAGIGYSNVSKAETKLSAGPGSISVSEKNKAAFAWNTGFGVKTKLQDNISLDLGYKFVNAGKISQEILGDKKSSKIQAHELTAGVIVSF